MLQTETQAETVRERLSAEAEAERRRLQQEMAAAAADYVTKVEDLQVAHDNEVRRLKDQYENNMQVRNVQLITNR